MNAFVAATDFDWFRFLASRTDVDEVNFWYPKPWGGHFGVLAVGQPLLFKLKKPFNAIAGGGFFSQYWEVPLSIAWETFGWKNGAERREEFKSSIARLRREPNRPGTDPVIGCVLLVEPFFWPQELWIQDPPGFQRNIVRGRTYDLRAGDGKVIWDRVWERLHSASAREIAPTVEVSGGYGAPVLQPRRLGQGTFSALIVETYQRRCAVTGEKALPALDAAHIQPFSKVQTHHVRNGILLRSDVHRLFDAGYVTVTPEHRVEASRRMKEDFNDGDNYLKLHGARVWVPDIPALQPDPDILRWHNEAVFRG
ncbi:MAG TPA: HNH endonuclease signature motif containing protein [Longimicrobiales bacterium]|nr:HNH endonuclease signature motif containing protein [Longimicrobiales bacterium]